MPAHQINLLPKDEFEKKALGRFLIWALTVGRWIVVFTELLVILAFLSRFKLDQDLADLNESIREKQAIIAASSIFEQNFRQTQKRLNDVQLLESRQIGTNKLFAELSRVTPEGITFKNLSIANNSLNLVASAQTEKSLGEFFGNLSVSNVFKDISVANIVRVSDSTINFSLSFRYVK